MTLADDHAAAAASQLAQRTATMIVAANRQVTHDGQLLAPGSVFTIDPVNAAALRANGDAD